MVTAMLEYRSYVPSLTFALKFSSLKFSGNEEITYFLNNIQYYIEFEKNRIQNAKIECLEKVKESNNKKIEELNKELLKLKKKRLLIVLHKEEYSQAKKLKAEIQKLIGNNETINGLINGLKDDRFYSVRNLNSKYRNLLAKLNFSCKSSSYSDEKLIDKEIYEYNGDEGELESKAKAILAKLEKEQDKEIEEIKKYYIQSQKNIIGLEK